MMATELSAASRQLIDARLDNIERALMIKGLERGDRRQILLAIEDQILEMLNQTAGEEPTRDEVLQVLARLDPPEAYLELTDNDHVPVAPVVRENRAIGNRTATSYPEFSPLAIVAFVLLCFALPGAILVMYINPYALIPLSIVTIASGVCGTIAMHQALAQQPRRRGMWMAITACSCAPAVGFLTWIMILMGEGVW